jgi:TolB-like protein
VSTVALAVLVTTGCHSGRVETQAPGPISVAEQRARDAIRDEQALRARPLRERTVGVLPFSAAERDTTLQPLAYGLADLLLTDLAQSQRIVIVDRLQMDALRRELQMVSNGIADSTNAPRVGRLIQARQLVLGHLTMLPDQQVRIDSRIAEVQSSATGRPLAFSAPLLRILDAEKALAVRLLEELGVQVTPELRALVERRQTQVFPALLAYSRGVRFMANRQLPEAAAQFELAHRLDPSFTQASTRLRDVRSQEASERSATRVASDSRRTAGARILERVSPIGTTSLADRPGGPTDPSFPMTRTTLIIQVNAP